MVVALWTNSELKALAIVHGSYLSRNVTRKRTTWPERANGGGVNSILAEDVNPDSQSAPK